MGKSSERHPSQPSQRSQPCRSHRHFPTYTTHRHFLPSLPAPFLLESSKFSFAVFFVPSSSVPAPDLRANCNVTPAGTGVVLLRVGIAPSNLRCLRPCVSAIFRIAPSPVTLLQCSRDSWCDTDRSDGSTVHVVATLCLLCWRWCCEGKSDCPNTSSPATSLTNPPHLHLSRLQANYTTDTPADCHLTSPPIPHAILPHAYHALRPIWPCPQSSAPRPRCSLARSQPSGPPT